jgi:hypothetical protein
VTHLLDALTSSMLILAYARFVYGLIREYTLSAPIFRVNESINDHQQDMIARSSWHCRQQQNLDSRSRESYSIKKHSSSQDVAVWYCLCRAVNIRFIALYEIPNNVCERV